MNKQQAIETASRLAYEEDADQVVGKQQGEWVIRSSEDPENWMLEGRIIVNSKGVVAE